jgi:hypothetical protein
MSKMWKKGGQVQKHDWLYTTTPSQESPHTELLIYKPTLIFEGYLNNELNAASGLTPQLHNNL